MTHRTKAVRKGEDDLEAKLRRGFKRIGRQVAERAVAELSNLLKADPEDAAVNAAANAAIEGADWTLLIEPTEEQLRQVALDGAKQALLRLGVTDEDVTEQVFQTAADWAKERAAEMVGRKYNSAGDLVDNPDSDMSIVDSTRDELKALIGKGIEEGQSAQDLADAIEDSLAFSADRALLVARTEIIRANNQGHLAAFRASGVVEKKEWSTAEDGDVCDECEANEAQGPIDLDEDFESGDDAAPAHPNCRCTIVAVTAELEDNSTDDEEQSDEEDDGGPQ